MHPNTPPPECIPPDSGPKRSGHGSQQRGQGGTSAASATQQVNCLSCLATAAKPEYENKPTESRSAAASLQPDEVAESRSTGDFQEIQPDIAHWLPRAGAEYITRAPSGIWYVRMVVPPHLRALHPNLPREIRRSTGTAEKRLAATRARKMCLDYLIRTINADKPDMTQDAQLSDHFSITYAGGAIRADIPPGASTSTLALAQAFFSKLIAQMVGRTQRDHAQEPGASPSSSPAPAIGLSEQAKHKALNRASLSDFLKANL